MTARAPSLFRAPLQRHTCAASASINLHFLAACRKEKKLEVLAPSLGFERRRVPALARASDSGPHSGGISTRDFLGPARYCCSWLFPLAALLAIGNQQVAACLKIIFPTLSSLPSYWLSLLLSYSGVLYTYMALPALDLMLGRDTSNPPNEVKTCKAYMIPLYACVLLHLGMLLAGCMEAAHLIRYPAHFVGVLLSISCSGGLAFTVAHELLHGRTLCDKILSNLLLCPLFYMHWTLSHLCHHQKVGTYLDPATARYGESLYSFLPRTVVGNFMDGVQMEAKRIHLAGKNFIGIHNRILLWLISPILLIVAILSLCGTPGVCMLIGSSIGAICLVETVNYIEHYGLTRDQLSSGQIERVGPQHSWNADWAMTSAMTFQLQRHSHHHADPSVPYQALISNQSAPLLPASYPSMILLAMCPPLFFRIMNPKVNNLSKVK